MKSIRFLFYFFITSFLIPFLVFSQEKVQFSETIIVEDLERHLNVLASDSFD